MVNMKQFRGIFNNVDRPSIVSSSHFCKAILEWMGLRFLISSAMINRIGRGKDGRWCCECSELVINDFFKDKKVKHLLEIGTYLGVSALMFSRYADKVTTIDVWPRTEPVGLWDLFEVDIDYYVFSAPKELDKYIKDLDFDFAYIDANHDLENVNHDFSLVEKCGKVLFHDYYLGNGGVKEFVDKLPKEEMTFFKPFVYWEKK